MSNKSALYPKQSIIKFDGFAVFSSSIKYIKMPLKEKFPDGQIILYDY